ncbi:MAG TPA: hypothetical protein VLV31_04425 [Candidatus Acidoferrales bacterium]|nr:hypothetical protein [Candidatus Acidoferrales bacterium]
MSISRRMFAIVAVIALVIIAILGVTYANYSASTALGQDQQVATNPLSPPSSQPVIAANTTIIGTTPVFTSTTEGTLLAENPGVQDNYGSCTSVHSGNATVQCYGQLYQVSNGCIVLIVPVMDPNNNPEVVNQYYTLHNLPSTHPPLGSWVTITGQMETQPTGTSSSSESCPLNSINVTNVS